MYLTYGTTTLKVIDLNRYERTNVYTEDGTDLLYVKHVLSVTATYAPGGVPALVSAKALSEDTTLILAEGGGDTTANRLAAQPRGDAPGVATGINATPTMRLDRDDPLELDFSGPETDAELRYRLLKPRQKLILWAYQMGTGLPVRWLESPRRLMDVDAANGPLPMALDVVAAAGEPHSIAVNFTVSTCLPPCPIGSDRLILSHRWEMEHAHDDDGYLTRTITGTVVFHSGIRDLLGIIPDSFRNQFLHPIPLGFTRRVPSVAQSSDGLTIKYTIVDTDPTIVFSPGDSNCTNIELTEQFNLTAPDPTRAILTGVGGAVKIGLDIAKKAILKK